MKKTLLIAIASFTMATGPCSAGFSQQSISFTGPTNWTPGTSITLSVNLTYTGFNAVGSFLLVGDKQRARAVSHHYQSQPLHLSRRDTPDRYPIVFSSRWQRLRGRERRFGRVPTTTNSVPPGTYHITDITFSLAAGAPVGMYTSTHLHGLAARFRGKRSRISTIIISRKVISSSTLCRSQAQLPCSESESSAEACLINRRRTSSLRAP